MRPQLPKPCIICGTPFNTRYPERFQTCSRDCCHKNKANTSKLWSRDKTNKDRVLQNTLRWQAKNQPYLKKYRQAYYQRKKKEERAQ